MFVVFASKQTKWKKNMVNKIHTNLMKLKRKVKHSLKIKQIKEKHRKKYLRKLEQKWFISSLFYFEIFKFVTISTKQNCVCQMLTILSLSVPLIHCSALLTAHVLLLLFFYFKFNAREVIHIQCMYCVQVTQLIVWQALFITVWLVVVVHTLEKLLLVGKHIINFGAKIIT